jgi:RNA polymerase sigma factor (sigma-70 family)
MRVRESHSGGSSASSTRTNTIRSELVEPIDSQIADCLARGDLDHAGSLILRQYGAMIFGHLLKTLNDRSRAEEAFSKFNHLLWTKLMSGGLPGDLGVRVWVFRLGRDASRNCVRSDQKRRRVATSNVAALAADSNERISERLRRAEALAELIRIRALLTDDERELLTLTYNEELSSPEVAAILGISAVAVRRRLTRVRTKLRQLYRS